MAINTFAIFSLAGNVDIFSSTIVKYNMEFDVYVMANVNNFSAGDYIVTYNSSILEIIGVYNGSINDVEIPVNYNLKNGFCRIVNVYETDGITGYGYLFKIRFKSIGNGSSYIRILGNISDVFGNLTSINCSKKIISTPTILKVSAPNIVKKDFYAYLEIQNVSNLSSMNFDLIYDKNFLHLEYIDSNLTINWSNISNGIRMVISTNISFNACIAKLFFKILSYGETEICISNVTMSNWYCNEIYAYIENKSIIIEEPIAPIANFSYMPSSPTTQDTIHFYDESYDLDGYIINYTWNFGDGSYSYEKNPVHSYANDGIYNVTLIVKDDDGAMANITKQIVVSNVPPVANFSYSPENPTTADAIQFTDLSYDNDGIIVNYTWNFGDGSYSYEKNPVHSYANDGIYNVTLIVKDDDGLNSCITKQITVLNHPPIANFSYMPLQPTTQDAIYFYDESYDLDGYIINYTWNFGDGSYSYEKNPVHSYANNGIYYVTLIVKDDDGAIASITKTISVESNNPPIIYLISPSNGSKNVSVNVNFTIYVCDNDNDSLNVSFYLCNELIKEIKNITGNVSIYLQNLSYNTSYNWYVVVNDGKSSVKSNVWYFKTLPLKVRLNISISPPAAGYTIPNGGTYDYGKNVTIKAFSYNGYEFLYWSGDFSSTNSTITIKMDSNKNLVANFIDIEKPKIENITTSRHIKHVNITCIVTDNSLVKDVFLNITFPNGYSYNFSMEKIGNIYYYNISYLIVGEYKYFIYSKDLYDNFNLSKPYSFYVYSPIANFSYTFKQGEFIFNSTSYDLDGYIINYTWNFGDGSIAYGKNVSHRYSLAGTYNVTLTVKDNEGFSNSITKQIEFITYILEVKINPPNAGYVDINPHQTEYSKGCIVELRAYAFTNYEFSHWSGDASGNKNPLQIMMDSNKVVVANFLYTPYTPPYIPKNNPPVVIIDYPSNGSKVSDKIKIIGIAWDEDGNESIIKVEIRIDGKEWIKVNGTTEWEYEINLESGFHVIEARAYDGNDYSKIFSIKVFNNKEPFVSILYPSNGSKVSDKIKIIGIAWDEDGNESIIKVEIRIDGKEWIKVNGTTKWEYEINLESGFHVIEARAYDGNDYSKIFSIKVNVLGKKSSWTPFWTPFIIISIVVAILIIVLKNRKVI